MAEIPKLEIYNILILPPDKKNKIESLEKRLGKYILASFENYAYLGKLCKNQNSFYIIYQNAHGIEDKIIDLDATNVVFVKED